MRGGRDVPMRDEVDADFAGYVVSRQHRLLRAAYLVCGDEHLAQDLVQQALTKLALQWERVRDGNPDAYVNRILYRDAISWWRRFRRERLVETVDDYDGEDPDTPTLLRVDVQRALMALTPRQRAVLVLRYFEDLTETETADQLGVTVGTVKSQSHVALNKLRAAVAHWPEAELRAKET
jgi:RNA polymerase sigma-70 factor (sigma-E family)